MCGSCSQCVEIFHKVNCSPLRLIPAHCPPPNPSSNPPPLITKEMIAPSCVFISLEKVPLLPCHNALFQGYFTFFLTSNANSNILIGKRFCRSTFTQPARLQLFLIDTAAAVSYRYSYSCFFIVIAVAVFLSLQLQLCFVSAVSKLCSKMIDYAVSFPF